MIFFERGELKLLWPFYIDAFLSYVLFFMPGFLIVYFRDFGFSIFQISILTSMMPLFMILCEVPTGAFADIYGRKLSVLLSLFIQAIALFSIFLFTNYFAILVAFALIGIGGTFSSGAREAWITDLIKKEKKNLLHRYFVKSRSIESMGIFVSGILGAFMVAELGTSIIWIFAGSSFILSIILLSFAKEHFVRKKVNFRSAFVKLNSHSLKSIKYVRNHHVLFVFLIATAVIVLAREFNGTLGWVPLLQSQGFPDYAFGYLWSAMGFVGIFAPFVSLYIMKRGNERKFILNTIILTMIVLSLIYFASSILFASTIFMLFLFLEGMGRPVERTYFHRFIKSKLRATVGSIESMLIGIVGVIAMPLAGLSVDYLGPSNTIFISAIIMIIPAIIFFKIKDGRN